MPRSPLLLAGLLALLLTAAATRPARADSAQYASLQWGMRAAKVFKAWTVATTQGAGTIACNADTGITGNSPDLPASAILGGVNTVDPLHPDNYVDGHGHGTFTAGEMVGRGSLLYGVAPQAKLLVAKVLSDDGSGSSGSVSAGMLWCIAHGAQVVNLSLGGDGDAYDGMQAVVDYGCAHGVDFSVAAGNGSQRDLSARPATVVSPCLIVSNSSDHNTYLSAYSNWDENPRTITAPGANIPGDSPDGLIEYDSGTSMAAPMTSGTLLLLRGMGIDAQTAVNIILATARQPNLPTFGPAETRLYWGAGLLNAYAAVRFAAQLQGTR